MTNKEAIEKITDLGKSFEKQINELKKSFSDADENSKPKEKKYDAKSLMSRVIDVTAACAEIGETYQDVLDRAGKGDGSLEFEELKVVAKALWRGQGKNGKDWVPDLKDKNQYRYIPVFDTSSGFSFRYANCECVYTGTFTAVGARLCFPTKELAEFAGRTFLKKYAVFYGAEL